jgi:hypothetical protein
VHALVVPVLVWLDPEISFGSDSYSLGAGIGIVLILVVELVIAVGTAIGLMIAHWYLRRREKAAALAQLEQMITD